MKNMEDTKFIYTSEHKYIVNSKGNKLMKKQIRVIEMQGSGYERGFAYGQAVRDVISEVFARWKYFMHIKLNISDVDQWIKDFIQRTQFVSAVKKWCPDLLKEVEGFVEGSGMDFDSVFTFQCQDEIFWIDKNHSFNPTQYTIGEHCTSIGISRNGDIPTICGQNIDWFNTFDAYHCVLHITDSQSNNEQYVNSFIGFLGSTGMSNVSVSVNCNSLFFFQNNSVKGLPVVFVLRGMLSQPSYEKAIEFIKSVDHASGQNYTVGGVDKAVDFECSANLKAQFIPSQNVDRVYHTNHPFVNTDIVLPPWQLDLATSTTFPRFDYVEERLKDPQIVADVELVKNILRSHIGSVCVHHENKAAQGGSSASLIYIHDPQNPKFLVTNGPPCESEYTEFTFK